jgi:ribosomal protein L11 methyltransferase
LARSYPALDVESNSELLLALLDDLSPTAIETRNETTRVFFASADARDAAGVSLRDAGYRLQPVDVPDDDWARRSQADLQPVTVGRITVVAPWHAGTPAQQPALQHPAPQHHTIVIVPSMGFGTGHHETTRLCLRALQAIDLAGLSVLDVGTGSGVLAIAADRLGASAVVGIDYDPDAVQSARENLALNPHATRTTFEQRDVTMRTLPPVDVVTANLTGALLVRIADRLTKAVRSGGRIVLSGILADERDAVRRAFAGLEPTWERQDGEWVGLVLK